MFSSTEFFIRITAFPDLLMLILNVRKLTVSSVHELLEKMASFSGLPFSSSQFSAYHQLDHVVINDPLSVLGPIDQ